MFLYSYIIAISAGFIYVIAFKKKKCEPNVVGIVCQSSRLGKIYRVFLIFILTILNANKKRIDIDTCSLHCLVTQLSEKFALFCNPIQ